jgi:3-phenylpropionate/trans-cinnamate dioxygenase ferredoxin reductase subunit
MEQYSEYLVIGSGLAGTSAAEGIRTLDSNGSVAIIGAEHASPYDRPPLSKKLWFGKKKLEDVYLHNQSFYEQNGITLVLDKQITTVNAAEKYVTDRDGKRYRFGKLLLATGGVPHTLEIRGGSLEGIFYYRTIDDYVRLRQKAGEARSVTILGGGFIGSEMAAALNVNKLDVTMIYPSGHLCNRIFPKDLGLAMERLYESRNIHILKEQKPTVIEPNGAGFLVHTSTGRRIASDLVVAGLGVRPAVELAEKAGLAAGNGIAVNEYLQTSHPDIYAAGDSAQFPYQALGQRMRIEHWDNALNQGKHAGRNMAGAHEPFTYMPYFFSDLFEFGYEAVGEIDSRMDIIADWQKPFETGVLYYTRNRVVRGAMMCNVWNSVEKARDLIRRKAGAEERISP